jgi:hypothetical protein
MKKASAFFCSLKTGHTKGNPVNTRDIKVTTVSLTIETWEYTLRFNGELINPSTSREIDVIQRVIRQEAEDQLSYSRDPNELRQSLEEQFAPSSKNTFRYFRRLTITVSRRLKPLKPKINHPHRSKSRFKRSKR